MSNLSLPRLTYVTLKGIISNAEAKDRYGSVKLAYETTVERGSGDTFVVRHHGNPIAEFGEDHFTLDNAGWDSRTTADRLNRILRDNQTPLPSDPAVTDRLYYAVRIKDGDMILTGRPVEGREKLLRRFAYSVAHFSRVSPEAHYVLQGGDEYR